MTIKHLHRKMRKKPSGKIEFDFSRERRQPCLHERVSAKKPLIAINLFSMQTLFRPCGLMQTGIPALPAFFKILKFVTRIKQQFAGITAFYKTKPE